MAPKSKAGDGFWNGPRTTSGAVTLLVGTRKGLWTLKSDSARERWKLAGPHFLGHVIHHAVLDPRDGKTLLATMQTGHLGPTVFRSTDGGKTFKEASLPPKFPQISAKNKRTVDHIFWLAPGHVSEPGVWYAGVSPAGLFRTENGGDTWESVEGFNANKNLLKWVGTDAPPEGQKTHSIIIDPRDPKHMYLSCSIGGFFESTDGAKSWKPLNTGSTADFLPNPVVEYGQDPHCAAMCPSNPEIFYQQNHCGIYRMDRREANWVRIGRNMPKEIGDIGFGVALHPRNEQVAWVFPMDGTDVWPRTPPGGKPALFMTKDGGKSWKRQATGLPKQQGWFTVKRQALVADRHDPVGVYFGTTSGEVWGTNNEGGKWSQLVMHLPHIYSVEVAGVAR